VLLGRPYGTREPVSNIWTSFSSVADRFDFESLVRIQLGLIPEYLAMEV